MNDTQTASLRTALMEHGLEENIKTLNDVAPITPHALLHINYKSLMDDYHNGSITAEVFTIRQTKLWESLFYYAGKLSDGDLKKLMQVTNINGVAVTTTKQTVLYIAASP